MSLLLTLTFFLPLGNYCLLYTDVPTRGFPQSNKKILAIGICNSLFILISSLYMFLNSFIAGEIYQIEYGFWFDTGALIITWGLLFDSLTFSMLLIVSAISFFVHFYSIEYMVNDPQKNKFFSYISLFTFFMSVLITANNYLQLFLGWEGVGLCSFLLISFWHTRTQAYKSALKAMILNRVGDFFLLFGICIIFYFFRTLNFSVLSIAISHVDSYIYMWGVSVLDIISVLIVLGATGKSAQIGLHTWLPDAMEGPTPVSALIHAATMVTAGIFLLIRCSYIIETSEFALSLVTFFGGITAFFSATISLFQHDIKKIIAYSTCSQLGYMFITCGSSMYNVALYHLITHAFFKALLFLAAGSLIHGFSGHQHVKYFAGARVLQPITYVAFLTGTLAIIGFPAMSGYYSKDAIFENVFMLTELQAKVFYSALLFTAALTAIYSLQIVYWLAFSTSNCSRSVYSNARESGWIICLTLSILSLLSLVVGYSLSDIFLGISSPFLDFSIFTAAGRSDQLQSESMLLWQLKNLPVIAGLVSGGLVVLCYHYCYIELISYRYGMYIFFLFLTKRWLYDKVYNGYTTFVCLLSRIWVYFILDKGLLERFGPAGLAKSFSAISHALLNGQRATIFCLMSFLSFNIVILLCAALSLL